MKKLFVILVCLPLATSAQTQEILKNANLIVANNVTFRNVVNGLLDQGFKIDKIDSNYNTVSTEWKEYKNYTFKIKYDVRVRDSAAYITGKVENMNYVFDIINQKYKGVIKMGFTAMNEFATAISSNVQYEKR